MSAYVSHYNNVSFHSAIGYLTPKDKLEGRDREILERRDRKLADARERRKQSRQQQSDKNPRSDTPLSPPPEPAIDFAAIRAAVTIAAVLQLLGCSVGTRGQHRGPCPLHGSTSGTSRCFSANFDKNVFHCFKCGNSGNALDLWARAKNLSIYDAAVDLCKRLNIPLPTLPAPSRNREEEPVAPPPENPTMPKT